MDKEKLKKWAGYAGRYAGLGTLGGLFCFIVLLGVGVLGGDWPGGGDGPLILTLIIGIIGAGGGLLGGVIAKKWGALVGGFILIGLIALILRFLIRLAVSMW